MEPTPDTADAMGNDTDDTDETDETHSTHSTDSTDDIDDTTADALLRRADEIHYERADAAEGLERGVLIGAPQNAPNFALRRFTLAPGAKVPRHTNEVEHEQYVLEGEYVVGIDETEHAVEAGDSLFIPAGTVHWYRNESDGEGSFLCAVPNGDDEMELADESTTD